MNYKFLQIIFLVLITMIVSGCGGIQPSNILKIKKIGIISNVDNVLYIVEDSTVLDSIDIINWDINDYITNTFTNNMSLKNISLQLNNSINMMLAKYSNSDMMIDDRINILKPIMKRNKLDAILYIGNKPKILTIHPMGGLSIAKLLFGVAIKKEALCVVDLYQNTNGKITFNREYMFSITDLNEKIWNNKENTIYKSYVNELEGQFKKDIKIVIENFISEYSL